MSNRLEEPRKTNWETSYGLLSTFTHPRLRSVATLFAPGESTVRLGQCWDEDLFVVTANYIIQVYIAMLEFTGRLVPPDSHWFELAKPTVDRGRECRERLWARATTRLGEQ